MRRVRRRSKKFWHLLDRLQHVRSSGEHRRTHPRVPKWILKHLYDLVDLAKVNKFLDTQYVGYRMRLGLVGILVCAAASCIVLP